MKQIFTLFIFLVLNANAQINFQDHTIIDSTFGLQWPQSTFLMDFDGDSDPDILVSSDFYGTIVWFENLDGLGNFGKPRIVDSNAISTRTSYAEDLNNDGANDIIAALNSDNKLVWYNNLDGLGNFSSSIIISESFDSTESIFVADLDNDGDNDILTSEKFTNTINWYENTDGQGDFAAKQIITSNVDFALDVYASDIDGDGDIDVLSASALDNKIAWYENLDGLGSFGTQQIIDINAEGAESVSAADINGDGYIDVLSSSGNNNTKITWYENLDGLGTFDSPQVIHLD